MDTTNKLRIGAVAIVLGGFLLLGYMGRPSRAPEVNTSLGAPPAVNTATNADSGAPAAATEYTLAQVAEHKTAKSCWAAVGGSVYDLTEWAPMHPGGAARILGVCGTDATTAFDKQHGMDERALDILPNYRIGALKQ